VHRTPGATAPPVSPVAGEPVTGGPVIHRHRCMPSIYCRQLLNRMSPDTAAKLQSSFIQFISKFIQYVDKYFSKNAGLLEAISFFGYGIENLTWNHIQKCVEVTKIEGLNEDNLFNEFTELKLTFESIKKKKYLCPIRFNFFFLTKQKKKSTIHQ
jgi:hypothetical protein